MFLLERFPERVVVVGAGFIACEFAGIMNGLGVEVTQFYRGAQILRGFDEEARGHIADHMIRDGIRLHTGTNILRMQKAEGGGIEVVSTTGQTDIFDQVMFATGRAPNTKGIGLEEAGVAMTERGRRLGSTIDLTELFYTGTRNSAADHLRAQGWSVTVQPNSDAYVANGFAPPADELIALTGDSGYLTAQLG